MTQAKVKFGVQMYNFIMGGDWPAIDSQEGVEQLLTRIAAAGYDGVEWCNFMLDGAYLDFDATKAKMDELGLETAGMHFHYFDGDLTASCRTAVERCVKLGCDSLIFAYSLPDTFGMEPDKDGHYTQEQIDQWVVEINKVTALLKDAAAGTDIQILYHNHNTEMLKCSDGSYVLDKLDVDAREVDVYWTAKGLDGKVETALDYVRTNADKIAFLHMKDGLAGSKATGEMCGWGKGTYDLQAIVDEARKNPKIGWIIVENDHPENFSMSGIQDAEESAAYAKANIRFDRM